MRTTLAVPLSFAWLAACASGPRLPAPPSAELRAQWTRVDLVVLPASAAGFEIGGPPTSLFGRMGAGAEEGFQIGAGASWYVGLPDTVVSHAFGAIGGLFGAVAGPFCGPSGEEIAAQRARLAEAVRTATPHEQLATTLRWELESRGTSVLTDSAVRCEVQFTRCALRGPADFDPSLGVELVGELTMRRGRAVEFVLPFAWRGPSRLYSDWNAHPGELASALHGASAQIAKFLADELLCTVDVAWGGGKS